MGEARGGDGRPAETATGRTERVAVPESRKAARRGGRIGLSVPQVAGSAVAAVVAAKLASNLGVYGTIVGAGVVSALGTCGGTVLQHVFQHTGRRVQEAAVQVRRTPATSTPSTTRAVPPTGDAEPPAATGVLPPTPDAEPTAATHLPLPTPDAEPTAATGALAVGGAAGVADQPFAPSPQLADPSGPPSGTGPAGAEPGGYGEPTSYRTGRGWKRPVAAVALAFGLTMGGITAYEAIAGEDLGGNGHGTTIGNAFTGHSHTSSRSGDPAPSTSGSPHGPAPSSPTPGATRTPARDGHRTDRPTTPATPTAPPPTSAPATPTPAPSTTSPEDPAPTAPAAPTTPTENPQADPTP